jgi:response regulator RpfG family c-di-GMP phosphodiesterase
VEKTVTLIREGREAHFAPDAVDAFERVVEQFEAIRMSLDDQGDGMVESDEARAIR